MCPKISPKQTNIVRRNEKLIEIMNLLLDSQPSCIVIEGKAGAGKSFFLKDLVENIKNEHFVIFRKIARTENEKIVLVLGDIAFKLEDDIKAFVHWSADKEKVVEVSEMIAKWVKNVLKIPEDVPVEKIPSIIAGMEKVKYERGFIYEFKDTLNDLIKYIPKEKRMVIILDQAERIDPKELNLLYDIMEELPERTMLILASRKPGAEILSPDVQAKITTKFLPLGNFTEKETGEMLKLSGIPFDEKILKKFYRKFKGFPLLQGMAIDEMKSTGNYNIDRLPGKMEQHFKLRYNEIIRSSNEELHLLFTLSIFRECLNIDDLNAVTNIEKSSIATILRKDNFSKNIVLNAGRRDYCYEPFHSLFSEFVCGELEKTSRVEFEKIHSSAAEYYANKLLKSSEISPGEVLFAMVEAPYHASKAKSPKLLELIKYSSKIKTMWGYLDEAKEEFEVALAIYQKNGDKKGMSYMQNELGLLYQNWGKPEQALDYYQKALEIAEELEDIRGKAARLNNIGLVYKQWGRPEQALDYYQKALEIDEELKDIRGKATRLNNIGVVYQHLGKPEQALDYYQKALEIDEELKDIRGKAVDFNNIGSVYKDWGKLEQALDYYQKALEIAEALKDIRRKATMLNNIGFVYQQWGKPEQALDYYQKALEIDEELKDIRGKATMLNNIGSVYKQWGKPEQALEYYQKSLEINEELKDIRGKAVDFNNIGSVYQDWGKPEQALDYYQKALEIDEELKDLRGKATRFNNIGQVYKDLGKPEQALEYYQKALKIFEALKDGRSVSTIKGNIDNMKVSR